MSTQFNSIKSANNGTMGSLFRVVLLIGSFRVSSLIARLLVAVAVADSSSKLSPPLPQSSHLHLFL